jgi:hypothetical protein
MSRYKGRISFKAIERDFPHHVDMPVPENGRDIIRWCFAGDLANAEASLDHLIRGSKSSKGSLADILLAVAPKTGERR